MGSELVEPFMALFFVGLLGAGHCLGMCGGISASLSFALGEVSAQKKVGIILAYNVGRLASYTLIGLVAGVLGKVFQVTLFDMTGLPILRLIAAVMLILMGLYVSGWWRVLTHLERIGGTLWRLIQPLSKHILPVKNSGSALLLGALWGWLPCGLVYSALAYALAQGSPQGSAAAMLAFGLGTLPALVLAGFAGDRVLFVLKHYRSRVIMGIILMTYGVWTAYFSLHHTLHAGHSDTDYTGDNSAHTHHSHR